MPTTYAHYRFGRDVLALLPEETRRIIEAHRQLFDFGVHGPDLLFYYKPLFKNEVNQTGYICHRLTGRVFFTRAIATAARASDREAALSYLYGLLCHFALDRECHPYVGEKEKEASHSLIEASFDGFLMQLDGLDPLTHNVTAHLIPSRESAAVIAPFYAPRTVEQIYQAEKSIVFYLKQLIVKGRRRKALVTAMKLAGHPSLADLLIPQEQDPRTVDSDQRLLQLYEGAVPLAVTLIEQANGLMRGDGELGTAFDHTFGVN